MTFSICLHTPLIQSYCRLPVRLPVFWGSPFNTRSIPHYRLSSSVAQLCLQSRCHFVTPHTHTHPPHTPHTHTGTRTRTNVNFDPLVTWDVCLGNALRSIPPVIPPFNTSRSIPPFNTLLNRRLPHIHRGPGVLTHTHILPFKSVSHMYPQFLHAGQHSYCQKLSSDKKF